MGRKRPRGDRNDCSGPEQHKRACPAALAGAPRHPRPAQFPGGLAPDGHPQATSSAAQNIGLHVYYPSLARWAPLDPLNLPLAPASPSPPSPPSPHLRLKALTYNTFSSAPSHTLSQSAALLRLIEGADADVVALQEVSSAFFSLLSREGWVRERYAVTTPEEFWAAAGEGHRGPGSKEGEREACVLLLRKELLGRGSEAGFVRLDRARDEQGKAAVWARLRIVTSHFTSLPQHAAIRAGQYRACVDFLSSPSPASSPPATDPHPHPHLLLLGDFNASSESEFAPFTSSPLRLVDACPPPPTSRKRPFPASSDDHDEALFQHRPTFGALYPWVTPSARKPRKPRRIDRVFLSSSPSSSPGATAKVLKYTELGASPLVNDRGQPERDRCGKGGRAFASDHLGVAVKWEWRRGGKEKKEGVAQGEGGQLETKGERRKRKRGRGGKESKGG
ncbi:hypothetical protein JCM10213_007990 [Rhodosporidiobolus nylandii]